MRSIVCLQMSLTLLMLSGAKAEVAITPHSQAAMALEELDHREFFRDATCAEFSNFMLEQSGLPPLGQNIKLKLGERIHLNRPDHIGLRPSFEDGLKIFGSASQIHFHGSPKGSGWELAVEENYSERGEPNKIKSVYRFKVVNQGSAEGFCRLDSVDVSIQQGLVQRNFQLTGRSCLRGYVDAAAPVLATQRKSDSSPDYKKQILKTCANGMSYFSDLRDDAAAIANIKWQGAPRRVPAHVQSQSPSAAPQQSK